MSKIRLGKSKDSRTRSKPKAAEMSEAALLLKDELRKQTAFADYLLMKGFSSRTTASYVKDVQRFETWTDKENMQVEQIHYADILHYIQEKKKDINQRSVSTTINSLKHYYNYLHSIGTVTDNPTVQIRIRGIKRKKLYQILSKQELESLYHHYEIPSEETQPSKGQFKRLEQVAKRNKIILGLLIYQGLNTQELSRLTEKDLKLREGKIYIAGSRRSNERTLTLQAHQVLDMMEYTLKIRAELETLSGQKSEQLLINSQGGKNFGNVMTYLMKQLKKQNSKVGSVKQIRTSVITHWLKIHNLREVQQMAGHRYVSSTEAYLVNDLDDLQEDISKFHPIG